jgi:hypothetical protein
MTSLISILQQQSDSCSRGNCDLLEKALEQVEVTLDSDSIKNIKQYVCNFPLAAREEIKRILFEAHLRKYQFTQERVEEYAKLDKLYTSL